MNKIQKILTDARDLINKYGLHKGDFGNRRVGFCAMGAIRAITKSEKLRDDAMRPLRTVSGGNIVTFNDSHFTKKRDVTKKFTQAIKLAGKQN